MAITAEPRLNKRLCVPAFLSGSAKIPVLVSMRCSNVPWGFGEDLIQNRNDLLLVDGASADPGLPEPGLIAQSDPILVSRVRFRIPTERD